MGSPPRAHILGIREWQSKGPAANKSLEVIVAGILHMSLKPVQFLDPCLCAKSGLSDH